MGKKPFINRKEAKHYHVVHRSQKDPLINDENASQRVLQEVVPPNLLKHKTREEIQSIHHRPEKLTQDEIDEKVGQAALHGIYFDDADYDYTQHLRPIGATDAVFLEAPSKKKEKQPATGGISFVDESANEQLHPKDRKVHLPEGVLPTDYELYTPKTPLRSIDLLEGGLQPDMDPRLREIMEALDDDAYVENDEEDYFETLNAPGERYEPDEDEEYDEYYEEEYYEEDELDENGEPLTYEDFDDEAPEAVPMPSTNWEAAFKQFKKGQKGTAGSDDEDDRRSGVTGMSRATTASHRNANLTLLDERFEKIEEEYEDDDDDFDSDEDGEDLVTREDFESILDDFLDKYEVVGRRMVPKLEGDTSEAKLETIRNALGEARLSDDDKDEKPMPSRPVKEDRIEGVDVWERPVKQRAAWDCQTVLTTYSNMENHPRLIKENGGRKKIHIDPKTGMPVLVEAGKKQKPSRSRLRDQADEGEQEEEDDEDAGSDEEERVNLGVARSKDESKEDKKARKAALKEQKRSRRTEKKATKEAFKNEEAKQVYYMQSQRVNKGVKHIA